MDFKISVADNCMDDMRSRGLKMLTKQCLVNSIHQAYPLDCLKRVSSRHAIKNLSKIQKIFFKIINSYT